MQYLTNLLTRLRTETTHYSCMHNALEAISTHSSLYVHQCNSAANSAESLEKCIQLNDKERTAGEIHSVLRITTHIGIYTCTSNLPKR